MPDLPALFTADVAAIGGVKPASVSKALQRSKPGGPYEEYPFPAPDGRIGGRGENLSGSRPWWDPSRRGEIEAWFKWVQDRSGIGGRPSKSAVQEA
jgi:hypothetical protein